MTKKITVEIGEKNYTLEFDRKQIVYTEEVLGFNIIALSDKYSIANLTRLWVGAMRKHHSNISHEKCVDLMYQYRDEGGDMEEVIGALGEMFWAFSPATQADTKPKKKAILE